MNTNPALHTSGMMQAIHGRKQAMLMDCPKPDRMLLTVVLNEQGYRKLVAWMADNGFSTASAGKLPPTIMGMAYTVRKDQAEEWRVVER